MAKTKSYGWLIAVIIALVIAVAFFVTSVVLADIHEVSLVREWQNWFGIAKEVKEAVVSNGILRM